MSSTADDSDLGQDVVVIGAAEKTGGPLKLPGPGSMYSPELAQMILDLYVDGSSLTKISQLEGMPSYNTLIRWVRDKSDFRAALKASRVARAFHFEERIVEIADKPIGKDDVPGERLRFDVLRWGAEVGSPDDFGKKMVVQGDESRPIVFKVTTGVPAPGLPSPEQPVIDVTPGAPAVGTEAPASSLLDRLAKEQGVEIPDEPVTPHDPQEDLT